MRNRFDQCDAQLAPQGKFWRGELQAYSENLCEKACLCVRDTRGGQFGTQSFDLSTLCAEIRVAMLSVCGE